MSLRGPCYLINTEELKLLLDNGADVNAQDTYLSTPLHKASHLMNTEKMKLLLDYKANVNAQESLYAVTLCCR